jgi:hydrogenase large subunit
LIRNTIKKKYIKENSYMSTTLKVGPLTRIEGHLDIEVAYDTGKGIVEAKSAGTMFRGFEAILKGRDPRDAPHLTQRICGVCPVSHGMAASLCLEAAFKITPYDNGRILRNLIL